jgi:uncharacterized protein (TIGR03118 family)
MARAGSFVQTNLVTDDPTVNPAILTDPSLVNAWGMSYTPGGPFWVSDNGTHFSTLYQVNPTTNLPTKLGLSVAIPGEGSVTGQAFNPSGFNGDRFLFVSEDGTISGWRGALGTNAEVLRTGDPANVYKGAAQATLNGYSYLYAANFRAGTIDVLKGDTSAPNLTGNFTDPNLAAGFAPFNVQKLGNTIYVTYAKQDSTGHDDLAGAGNGFVSAFDTNGNFIGRIASHGTLNSPWGLALAPAGFGDFGGDLLVGNFGDGTINAFNLSNNTFAGQLLGPDGNPIQIDGLWGLLFGNGGSGGSADYLYFSAGPDDESHGLFGSLQETPEPASLMLLVTGGLGLAGYGWRRGRNSA